MKDGIFKKLKDNVKNAINLQDDYIDDDEDYGDDDYDDFGDLNATQPAASAPSFNAAPYTPYAPAPAPAPAPSAGFQPSYSNFNEKLGTAPASAQKKNAANIYRMNEVKPTNKLKVSLFVLEDMDDARNVADCMIERNVVTICDFSKISSDDQRRVLDFLDGVKYVCNSRIENISPRIYLIVPEAAELSGDFFSQIDQDTLY